MVETKNYAVAIGGSNIDILATPKCKIIPKDSNNSEISISPGGVVRNIAENLSLLKNNCHLISVFGKDELGNFLKSKTISSGVSLKHSLTVSSEKTSSYLSINDLKGEMNIAFNDTKILKNLTPNFLSKKYSIILNSSAIILDANLQDETLEYVFKEFKDNYIFADPVSLTKSKKLKKYIKSINVLKPNLEEAILLYNLKTKNKYFNNELSNELNKKNTGKLLISLGHRGVISFHNKEIKNANGAGDALMAGLVHGQLRDWSWDYTVKFAISMASIATQSTETVNPNINQKNVTNFLKENFENG
jgi:pseudouridine kinase